MTRAYVLDSASGRAVLGLIDQSWEKLSYTRRYFGMDTFELTINRSRLWADQIQTGRLLYLPDEGNRIFLIEQVQEVQEGSLANDEMTVTGRSLEGIAMAERLVIPPAGQDYDKQTAVKSETAIKHYVTDHASASATDANRRIPGLVVIASAARGNTITVSGRYQTVFDLVNQIGLMEGIGWEILYNPTLDQFEFDIVVGTDRSASVFFDFAFETLEKWEELDSIVESKTLALVAGQGEGSDRDVVVRYQGAMPTGFARREAFIDARDIEKGGTTELNARGDSFLAAAAKETRLEATIHQYGSFKYGPDWDMGDIVLIRNQERGISYSARVIEVKKEFAASAAAPVVTAVIDRPFPTLKDQVAAGSGNAGAGKVDYPDTLNPKVDSVIFNRLNPDARLFRETTNVIGLDDNAGGLLAGLRVQGQVWARRAAASDNAFLTAVGATKTTNVEHVVKADGKHEWGDGTNARDTNLYRSAAAKLRTDGYLEFGSAGDVSVRRGAAGELYVEPGGAATNAIVRATSASGAANYAAFIANQSGDAAARAEFGYMGDQQAVGMGLGPGSAARDVFLYRDASNSWLRYDTVGTNKEAALLLRSTGTAAVGVSGQKSGDTAYRWYLSDGSGLNFGPGNAALDTNLYRSAANVLKTDDSLIVSIDLTVTGNIHIGGSNGGSGSGTVTLANQGTATTSGNSFSWVKYGRLVLLTFGVTFNANGSGTGTVTFTFSGAPAPATIGEATFDRGGSGVLGMWARYANSGGNLQFARLNTWAGSPVTGADLVSGAGYTGTIAYMASS